MEFQLIHSEESKKLSDFNNNDDYLLMKSSDNSKSNKNEDNLIYIAKTMTANNILTFDEFLKNTMQEFKNKQNLQNPQSNSSSNRAGELQLCLPKNMRTNRSEKQLVLSPLMARRRQGSARSLGGHSVTTPNGVLESSRVALTRNKSGQLVVNEYVIRQNVLGRGAFAEVRLCENLQTMKQYAVKILDQHRYRKARFSKSQQDVIQFMNKQVAIFKKLTHPNIVKLYEVIDDQQYKKMYMIMEHCQRGSLKDMMKKHKKEFGRSMNQKEIRSIFRGLLLALQYLHHTVGIAHCDIKPENILISSDGSPKLSDFGLSKQQYFQSAASTSGTLIYMSPQAINGDKVSNLKARDVWSLGVTLFEVTTGRLPYPNAERAPNLSKLITNFTFNFDLQIMSENLKIFLHRCLQKDPTRRADVKQLMMSKWITEGDGLLRQLPQFSKGGINVTAQQQQTSIVKKRKPSTPNPY